MSDTRLLERLKFREKHPEFRQGYDSAREVRSIIRHINEILNTRQGSCEIHDDMGIPDFMNTPGSTLTQTADNLVESITEVLIKYEPRITDVKVTFEPEPGNYLNLRFRLEAVLKNKKTEKVVLETQVSSDGLVRVAE